ncbi:hypothetical protein JCM17846_04400 [Iodidimonas nitroreducens]|uniref:Heme exporter protein D n=1 Tax=Iodidimonas nitroreducens TaxID=1236968 RepID=A0A5A7N3P9_9PROT|nr:heme exporter protein CcmD [Iodidimonas nitroreducens]GAK32473.1 heme exporter protein CcmD [alpha proteobacterium Q-1]GER02758.1 hypothetical protein JCM17846_04400 [Iodidimonas nitroreducens]
MGHEFFHMGGYGGYIWAAYGLVFLVLIALAWLSWREQKINGLRAEMLKAARSRRRSDHAEKDRLETPS